MRAPTLRRGAFLWPVPLGSCTRAARNGRGRCDRWSHCHARWFSTVASDRRVHSHGRNGSRRHAGSKLSGSKLAEDLPQRTPGRHSRSVSGRTCLVKDIKSRLARFSRSRRASWPPQHARLKAKRSEDRDEHTRPEVWLHLGETEKVCAEAAASPDHGTEARGAAQENGERTGLAILSLINCCSQHGLDFVGVQDQQTCEGAER